MSMSMSVWGHSYSVHRSEHSGDIERHRRIAAHGGPTADYSLVFDRRQFIPSKAFRNPEGIVFACAYCFNLYIYNIQYTSSQYDHTGFMMMGGWDHIHTHKQDKQLYMTFQFSANNNKSNFFGSLIGKGGRKANGLAWKKVSLKSRIRIYD